jgi:hypothetical protein
MAKTSDLGRIPPLTEDNYGEWAPQLRAWVLTQGFQTWTEHVELRDGFVPPVFDPVHPDAKAIEYWNMNSRIAGVIILTLSSTQKQHLSDGEANPAVMWRTLEAVHRRKGFSQYFVDFIKLLACKYVDGTSMQAHLLVHSELRKKIAAAGCWFRDDYYCGIFLSTLPESWENIVQNLISLKPSAEHQKLSAKHAACTRCKELSDCGLPESFNRSQTIDWTTISAAVLTEETRRSQKTQVSSDKGTALTAAVLANRVAAQRNAAITQSRGAARRDQAAAGITCAYCSTQGHDYTMCWQLNGYPPDHKLYNANFVKVAWKPAAGNDTAATATLRDYAWSATVVEPVNNTVAVSTTSVSDGTHEWALDSGASSHFCNDRSLFETFKASRTQVQVAAGKSITAFGIGSIALSTALPNGSVRTGRLNNVVYAPDMHSNLLSVRRLVARGTKPDFSPTGCSLIAPDGTVTAYAALAPTGLYRFTACATRRAHIDSTAIASTDWRARSSSTDAHGCDVPSGHRKGRSGTTPLITASMSCDDNSALAVSIAADQPLSSAPAVDVPAKNTLANGKGRSFNAQSIIARTFLAAFGIHATVPLEGRVGMETSETRAGSSAHLRFG